MKKLWSAVFLAFAAIGCNNPGGQPQLLEKVVFKPTGDLKVAEVSLVFTDQVKASFHGFFEMKEYGMVYAHPYSPDRRFEIGFQLNLDVFNDQDYVKLDPTSTLPNGMPLGIPHPVVEVRSSTPIDPSFDLMAYVDTAQASWLGMGMLLAGLDQVNFPAGLSINQVFLRDGQGNPGVVAGVFGPVLDQQGGVVKHGGISLVANVRQLIDAQTRAGGSELILYPEEEARIEAIPADPAIR